MARGFQQPAESKKTKYAPVMNKVSMRMIFSVGKGRARCLQYVRTEDNVADMLTKRLGFS